MTYPSPWCTVAPTIATAGGHLGHNIDHLPELDETQESQHIHDPYIPDLIAAVRAYGPDISPLASPRHHLPRHGLPHLRHDQRHHLP